MTKPFFCTNECVGVILEGNVGFDIAESNSQNFERKNAPTLKICPLKYKQAPGKLEEDNDVVRDKSHVDLVFGSKESVYVLISALQKVKEVFDMQEKEAKQ